MKKSLYVIVKISTVNFILPYIHLTINLYLVLLLCWIITYCHIKIFICLSTYVYQFFNI